MTFKAYKIKSISFDGSAIISLQNVNFSSQGATTIIQGDGNLNIEDVFVDSNELNLTVDVEDISEINTINAGDAGATVLVFEQRASSNGAVIGADITATIAASRVTDVSLDAPSSGAGNGSLSITGAGPNDTAIVVWS